MIQKTLQELDLCDDFLFAKVMEDPEICRQILEKILDVEIEKIILQPVIQKVIENAYESKGVRLDVYVKDGKNTIYNVEMQTTDTKELPKRTRYYQGAVDLDCIQKGESYKKLNKSYIIFICTFDPFGKGNYYYSFTNRCCQYSDLELGDDTKKIFLNTNGKLDDVSKEVKVNKVAEVEYMTLLMRENEIREEALEKGEESAKRKLFFKAFQKGKSCEEIADLFDMTVEEVRKLLEL